MEYNAIFFFRKETRCTDMEQFPWGDGEWKNKFFIPFALLNIFSIFGNPAILGWILFLESLWRQIVLPCVRSFPSPAPALYFPVGLTYSPHGMLLVFTFFTNRKPVFPHSLFSQCRVDIFTCMSFNCLLNQCLQGPWSTSSNLLSSLSCLLPAIERLRTKHSQWCGL